MPNEKCNSIESCEDGCVDCTTNSPQPTLDVCAECNCLTCDIAKCPTSRFHRTFYVNKRSSTTDYLDE